jgi:hypothetical protein
VYFKVQTKEMKFNRQATLHQLCSFIFKYKEEVFTFFYSFTAFLVIQFICLHQWQIIEIILLCDSSGSNDQVDYCRRILIVWALHRTISKFTSNYIKLSIFCMLTWLKSLMLVFLCVINCKLVIWCISIWQIYSDVVFIYRSKQYHSIAG